MPASIVRPGEEHFWERAKARAAKQDHKEDWPYVTAIFLKMVGRGSLKKGFYIPEKYRAYRIPGQVPPINPNSPERRVQDDLQKMPDGVSVARLLDHDSPRASAQSVVDNLGLDMPTQRRWTQFLEKAVRSSPNELTYRKSVHEQLTDARMGSELRMAIMQRAVSHWRTLHKGLVEILTPDEALEKAWGSERPGHKYLRRKRVGDHWEYEYPGKPGSQPQQLGLFANVGNKSKQPPVEPPMSPAQPPVEHLEARVVEPVSSEAAAHVPEVPLPLPPEPTPEVAEKPKERFVVKPEPREAATEAAVGVLSGGKWDQLKAAGWTVKWEDEVTGADEVDPDKGVGPLPGSKARQLAERGLVVVKPRAPEPEKPKLVLTQPEAKAKEGLTAEIGEHVWGSRKDRAVIRTSADLDGMTPEAQAKAVTKKVLMPKWEPEDLLEAGWSPDGVLMRRAVENLIVEKPGNSIEARKGYFEAIDFIASSMENCRTAVDVLDFIEDWKQLIQLRRKIGTLSHAEFMGITDAYLTAQGNPPKMLWPEREAFEKKVKEAKTAYSKANYELMNHRAGTPGVEEKTREITRLKNAYIRLQAEQDELGGKVPLYAANSVLEQHYKKSGLSFNIGRSDANGNRGFVIYQDDPTLGKQLENPYVRMAVHGGDKLVKTIAGGGGGPYGTKRSKGYEEALQHAAVIQRLETSEEKEAKLFEVLNQKREAGTKERRKPFHWERSVSGEIKRVGGRPVEKADPEGLAKDFNFKNVQFGGWVNEDEADSHIRGAHGALYDLADLMGVEPKHISINGRLSLAFGARGGGKASAHYEPDGHIINITKIAGGGSLAHEYGHALDFIISAAGDPSSSKARRNLSGGDIAGVSPRVAAAMDKVMGAIYYKDPEVYEARKKSNQLLADTKSKKLRVTSELQAEYNRLGRIISRGEPSDYHADATTFSNAPNSYWTRPHELFARAFESYVEDALVDQKRNSTYLVAGTRSTYDTGRTASKTKDAVKRVAQVYPQGEERKAINQAIKEFVAVLQEENTLEKSLQALEDLEKGQSRMFFLPSEKPTLKKTREPRGGTFHRRVPKPGGGFTYYYDPEKYAGRKDAHLTGEEATKAHLHGKIHKTIAEQGKGGAHIKHFAELAKKHGSQAVAEALRENVKTGKLNFKKGRFHGKVEEDQEAEKSTPEKKKE